MAAAADSEVHSGSFPIEVILYAALSDFEIGSMNSDPRYPKRLRDLFTPFCPPDTPLESFIASSLRKQLRQWFLPEKIEDFTNFKPEALPDFNPKPSLYEWKRSAAFLLKIHEITDTIKRAAGKKDFMPVFTPPAFAEEIEAGRILLKTEEALPPRTADPAVDLTPALISPADLVETKPPKPRLTFEDLERIDVVTSLGEKVWKAGCIAAFLGVMGWGAIWNYISDPDKSKARRPDFDPSTTEERRPPSPSRLASLELESPLFKLKLTFANAAPSR